MRFRLRTFLVLIMLVSVMVGWLILRWQHEHAIQRRLLEFDRLQSAAGELQSKIHEIILADPVFAGQFSDSPIPPVNRISGGCSKMSDGFSVPPDRRQFFEFEYHYYWPDASGFLSTENDVLVKISSSFDEKQNLARVLYMDVSDSRISRKVVKMIESEIAQHDVQIVKQVTNQPN